MLNLNLHMARSISESDVVHDHQFIYLIWSDTLPSAYNIIFNFFATPSLSPLNRPKLPRPHVWKIFGCFHNFIRPLNLCRFYKKNFCSIYFLISISIAEKWWHFAFAFTLADWGGYLIVGVLEFSLVYFSFLILK